MKFKHIPAFLMGGAFALMASLSMQICSMIRFGLTPEINAMAGIVVLVSFALVLLAQRLNHGRMPGA
jgi:spermidine/putrescine transport system permease protein